MRSVTRVVLRLFVVCLLAVTLLVPAATASTRSGSKWFRRGIIARILDYVLPDINMPPG
jgi:hypothetical protein